MIKKIEVKPDPNAFGDKKVETDVFRGFTPPAGGIKIKYHNLKKYGNSDKKN